LEEGAAAVAAAGVLRTLTLLLLLLLLCISDFARRRGGGGGGGGRAVAFIIGLLGLAGGRRRSRGLDSTTALAEAWFLLHGLDGCMDERKGRK